MNWKRYITPALAVTVVIALLGFSGNLICDNIKDNKKAIEKKVDNETLKQMIQVQQEQIKANRDGDKRDREDSRREFDRIYKEIRDLKK